MSIMKRDPNRLSLRIPWLLELSAEGTLAIGAFLVVVALLIGGRALNII
ncbi:hypothetical protein [Bosea sp. (in: a-proteobacteria)]|jgi:hypothetical protein|nr:hypothetical protein [Bosea sp. (in: a-proteobacteria)]